MRKILATIAAGLIAYGSMPDLPSGGGAIGSAEARGGGGGGRGGGGGFGGGGGRGGFGGGYGGGYGGGFHGGGYGPRPVYGGGGGGRPPAAATRPSKPPAASRPPSGQRPGAGQKPGAGQRPGAGQKPGAGQRPGDGQRPGVKPTPPIANAPGAGGRPPGVGNRPPLQPGARPPGWRPPGSRPPGWRPPAARPPYPRPPHWHWGDYHWYPAWGWYFTGAVAGASLAFVDTLPDSVDCATNSYQGESLYMCGDVLYRATYLDDDRVYEIVSDEGASGGDGVSTGPGSLRLASPRMRGSRVRALQEALVRDGMDISVDGIFGPGTDQALRDFQARNGLQATGELDEDTAAKLGI
ncbi:peptidoglycan-binding protein [Prosthecomicrobium sp. N25]|uniref:peptidoglycan-binding protein n=1 Tax=Prosthecomicrobium sp. N25 TaxID=3129254 RepID=UPI003076AA01